MTTMVLESAVAETQHADLMQRVSPKLHRHAHEIQPYGHVVKLPIALSEKACATSVELLNQILADTTNEMQTWFLSEHLVAAQVVSGCGQAHTAMKMMRDHFGDRVRFVFRHYPQIDHPHAERAAEAAEAAGAQGLFWPFHDALFGHQDHLEEAHLRQYAARLGLDMERYDYEMNDSVYLQRVREHASGAEQLGIRTMPAFFVNGTLTDVSFGMRHLEEAIEQALRAAR